MGPDPLQRRASSLAVATSVHVFGCLATLQAYVARVFGYVRTSEGDAEKGVAVVFQ